MLYFSSIFVNTETPLRWYLSYAKQICIIFHEASRIEIKTLCMKEMRGMIEIKCQDEFNLMKCDAKSIRK